MAEEEGQEVIFTENTAPDREIWDEKGGLIKKGAAEIAERDQDHVPEVKVLTTLGMFAVPVTAETTVGEIRQKVQEWKPEYSLEQIELVCKDKDAWGPLFNKTSRPRDDDETVESLWSDWDIPRRMMQVALWIKEKNEETGEHGPQVPVGVQPLYSVAFCRVKSGWAERIDANAERCETAEEQSALVEAKGKKKIKEAHPAWKTCMEPDREIWDEKGGLIKKGAAEIAERDQDHVPEVKVLTTLGMFAVPVTAETTVGEIRQKVQEWKPEYSLEQIELVCKDKDAWGPLFNKTSRPRDDDETVESLWSDWDIPRRMMQVALWIKEKNEETGEWESTFWKMLEESKCDDWSFQGHTI
ncbi:unnamed protein product [Durusdinium trenchii]|uniref:Uncharacterized protein n=2 Tax=Dinophyceae TaxID=2864 RepID=A0ABP0S0G0_9DINO